MKKEQKELIHLIENYIRLVETDTKRIQNEKKVEEAYDKVIRKIGNYYSKEIEINNINIKICHIGNFGSCPGDCEHCGNYEVVWPGKLIDDNIRKNIVEWIKCKIIDEEEEAKKLKELEKILNASLNY